MLPTSVRHRGVGPESSLQCGCRQHMLQPYRIQPHQIRFVAPAPNSCVDLLPLRAVQQADWTHQSSNQCRAGDCLASGNSLATLDADRHAMNGHCLSPAAHLASRSRRRQLQHSQLLVVALDRDGSHNDNIDDHEGPPEAGMSWCDL